MATEEALSASTSDIATGPFSGSGARVVWGDPTRAGPGLKVGVVCSRYNGDVTMRLLHGAAEALKRCGVPAADVTVAWVPGAFELGLVARSLAGSGGVGAVICLGCVIKGDTSHDRYVAGGAATGVQRVMLDTGVPIAFGVLTTDNREQALARAGGASGNKGYEAAMTACEVADLLQRLGGGKSAGPARRAAPTADDEPRGPDRPA